MVKGKAMGQAQEEEEEAAEDAEGDNQKISLQMSNALHTVNDLWQRHTENWSLNARNITNSRVNLAQRKPEKAQKSQRQSCKDPKAAQCGAYLRLTNSNITTWWRKTRDGNTPPTPEQTEFLEHVIQRCVIEDQELKQLQAPKAKQEKTLLSEPCRCALLGMPGAGKSLCLSLMRDFLKRCWAGKMEHNSNF